MLLLLKSILIASALAAPGTESNGYIGGVVVRANDGEPVAGAEIVLRIRQGNEFIAAAETVADENGRFLFTDLPVAPNVIYKPGANWGGIHYPGPATILTPAESTVAVKLTVNEAISEPNLLVARRHEITLRPKPGVLEVSEVILIDNPTMNCYVGKPSEEGGQPETLCLNIPSDFEQVTFDKEFYGRRFAISSERLVTGIPWTPGQAELRFTYVVQNDQQHLTWSRPLDLPCTDMIVRIVTDDPGAVSCSLETERREETGSVVYQYSGPELAAGHEIRVELGHLPVSSLAYGKWVAAGLLVGIVVIAVSSIRRRRRPAGALSTRKGQKLQDAEPDPKVRRSRARGRKRRSKNRAPV